MRIKCPKCKKTLKDNELCGVEVTSVYDGCIAWVCKLCGHQFARKGFEEEYKIAKELYPEINKKIKVRV